MPWMAISFVVGALLALIVVAIVIGGRLSRDHVAVVRARYAAPVDSVWAVLSDPLSSASWRKDVKRVEKLADINGHPAWREEASFGPAAFELTQSIDRVSRTVRIADDSLPFGGEWEYRLAPSGNGTELTLTERGFVKPPLFRFMARFLFGYTGTMRDYLRNLGTRLGEQVTPEIVESGK
jgi:hypothetical protein